jgi:N-methylhydantoinase A
MAVGAWDRARLDEARQTLRARLLAPLAAAGHGEHEMKVEEVASVRYSGQSYAIELPDPAFDDPARLGRDFLDRHEKLYGFATEEPWELVAIRQQVSIPRSHEDRSAVQAGGGAGPVKTAPCTFAAGEAISTPRYDRAGLALDVAISGPAIIEDDWSTVILPPGAALTPDGDGHLHIETGAAS